MKLSVCLITYNQEKYIEECVRGVLRQETTFPFEIVIGEDFSSDGTRAILDRLDREHPGRLRIFSRDRNVGMLMNFGMTLAACQGEYVATLEGDDVWTAGDKLQTQVDFLDSHPGCAMVCHAVEYQYEDGRPKTRFPNSLPEITTQQDLLVSNYIQTCAFMGRRKLLANVPPWVMGLKLGDWPLCIAMAQHGDIGFIDRVMAMYRVHSESAWSMASRLFRTQESLRMYDAVEKNLGVDCSGPRARWESVEQAALAAIAENEGRREDARKHISRATALWLERFDNHHWLGQSLIDAAERTADEYLMTAHGPRYEVGLRIRRELELIGARQKINRLERELLSIHQSRTYRLIQRLTRLPGVPALVRLVRKIFP